MSQELSESSFSRDDKVNIANTQVSMKDLQSIYHELTGKTEELSETFKKPHRIEYDDLYQLDLKINQITEHYKVISKNCSISIFYCDGSKMKISSFDRSKLNDMSSPTATESVDIEYNFLILPNEVQKPQNYKITLQLYSRVGVLKKAETEHGLHRKIMHLFSSNVTGLLKIEHVDYLLAKHFQNLIKEWYESIDDTKPSKILGFLKDNSEHLSLLFTLLSSIILPCIVLYNYSSFISSNPDISDIFKGNVAAFSLIFIGIYLSRRLASICEYSIDSYQYLSYVNLNRGDEKEISRYKASNRINILKMLGSLGLMIFINIISMYLIKWLGLS